MDIRVWIWCCGHRQVMLESWCEDKNLNEKNYLVGKWNKAVGAMKLGRVKSVYVGGGRLRRCGYEEPESETQWEWEDELLMTFPASISLLSLQQHLNFPLESCPHLSFKKWPAPGFSNWLRNTRVTLFGPIRDKEILAGAFLGKKLLHSSLRAIRGDVFTSWIE